MSGMYCFACGQQWPATCKCAQPDVRWQDHITRLESDVVVLRTSLRAALDHYERNICEHEETYRGGAIWTICTYCGSKWADDEGGFKPFEHPPEIIEAREALSRISGEDRHG